MRLSLMNPVRVALVLGCFWVGSAASRAQGVAKAEPIVADGAAFAEPVGWTRLKSDKAKTKGRFVSPDSTPDAPKRMIMVDVGKPNLSSLQATAEAMARDWGGKVVEEKTTLDGVEAIRVRVEKPGPGLRPVEGVLALKEGRLFMVMGGALPGQKVAKEVEEVRKGWKWAR